MPREEVIWVGGVVVDIGDCLLELPGAHPSITYTLNDNPRHAGDQLGDGTVEDLCLIQEVVAACVKDPDISITETDEEVDGVLLHHGFNEGETSQGLLRG